MIALLRYFRRLLGKILPNSVRCILIRGWSRLNVVKARVRLTLGVEPLSYVWGSDRGLSIYRYYLEQFLQQFSSDIRGHCLEFQNPGYTPRFGGAAIKKLDILHVDDSNPVATIVADLTKPNSIPSDRFDCVICTHVLHIIVELDKAVSELHRILRPGGVLLVAVPQVSMCDPDFHEIWRFTPEGLAVLLAKAFGKQNVLVRAYGNSLTAAGEIRGLVASEFKKPTLDYHDPRFAVEVCARACKAEARASGILENRS
jgi:SAM-dependent methyltransferase